jgi:hypothetical protein
MRRRYIPCALEPVLRKAAAQCPAVVLTGPRQRLMPAWKERIMTYYVESDPA